jgi:hypothetical protein
VLPTLSQCVSHSSQSGCEAVLPTLAQCTGSPTLQGCSVRLPSLATCAAAPSTPGCEAVLPQPSYCSTHPSDASCVVFGSGSGTQPVAQAVQTSVRLINQGPPSVAATAPGQPDGKPEDKQPGKDGTAASQSQAQNSGAKNEKPATKTYCN